VCDDVAFYFDYADVDNDGDDDDAVNWQCYWRFCRLLLAVTWAAACVS